MVGTGSKVIGFIRINGLMVGGSDWAEACRHLTVCRAVKHFDRWATSRFTSPIRRELFPCAKRISVGDTIDRAVHYSLSYRMPKWRSWRFQNRNNRSKYSLRRIWCTHKYPYRTYRRCFVSEKLWIFRRTWCTWRGHPSVLLALHFNYASADPVRFAVADHSHLPNSQPEKCFFPFRRFDSGPEPGLLGRR